MHKVSPFVTVESWTLNVPLKRHLNKRLPSAVHVQDHWCSFTFSLLKVEADTDV